MPGEGVTAEEGGEEKLHHGGQTQTAGYLAPHVC